MNYGRDHPDEVKSIQDGLTGFNIISKTEIFSEFGNVNKLLSVYNIFQNVYDRTKKTFKKQMKKDAIRDVYIDDFDKDYSK